MGNKIYKYEAFETIKYFAEVVAKDKDEAEEKVRNGLFLVSVDVSGEREGFLETFGYKNLGVDEIECKSVTEEEEENMRDWDDAKEILAHALQGDGEDIIKD